MCTEKRKIVGTIKWGKDMKKKLHRLWQRLLVLSIPVSVIGTIFWACCLDSESILPIVMLSINGSWLFLLVEANKDEKETENEIRNQTDEFEEF